MKRKILALMAAFTLMFSAGMTLNTAKAAGYQNSITASVQADTSQNSGKNILICIAIGIAIGGVITLISVSSMKSVHQEFSAAEYKKPDSLKLDVKTDNYLYNKIEKTPLPQQSSNSK